MRFRQPLIFILFLSLVSFSYEHKPDKNVPLTFPSEIDTIFMYTCVTDGAGSSTCKTYDTLWNSLSKTFYDTIISGIKSISSYGLQLKPKCGQFEKLFVEFRRDDYRFIIEFDILPCPSDSVSLFPCSITMPYSKGCPIALEDTVNSMICRKYVNANNSERIRKGYARLKKDK